MGLLDTILSTIDAKKRSAKRGIMDMLDNPQQWAGMQANRIQEDRYGGAENAQAMKQYLSKQPYDPKALTAANDALRNSAINESLGAVMAWHGSPHKFDKFDMSKIGTGEGAQAYGHGIYMAESPEVAKTYQQSLSGDVGFTYKGQSGLTRKQVQDLAVKDYPGYLDNVTSASGVADYVMDTAHNPALWPLPTRYKDGSDRRRVMEELAQVISKEDRGALYKVDIPDEAVSKFLDWDKPLSQQSPEVQKALSSMPQVQNAAKSYLSGMGKGLSEEGLAKMKSLLGDPMEKISGSAAYKALTEGESSNAADILKNQGIPGIRYLDGGSRSTGSGTSNYVLFDDQLPRILERNGQPTGLQPWTKGEWKGLLDEPAPKLTEFEQRHLTAQKNAALPVEQGGLGLPEGNTAMDRARAMGAIDAYHGSPNEIIGPNFNRQSAGVTPTNTFDSADANVFASSSPTVASEYAQIGKTSRNPYDEFYSLSVDKRNELIPLFNKIVGKDASRDDVYNILKSMTQSGNKEGAYGELAKQLGVVDNVSENVMPLMIMGKSHTVDWKNTPWRETEMQRKISEAKQSGADYLLNKNIIDSMTGTGVADSFAVLNPSAVRSRFAAFDPKRRHEADLLGYADPYLLGAMGAGGLLGLGGYSLMNDK